MINFIRAFVGFIHWNGKMTTAGTDVRSCCLYLSISSLRLLLSTDTESLGHTQVKQGWSNPKKEE